VYLAYCCDVRFEYLSAFVRLLSCSVANRCCVYECWFVSAVVMSLSLASQTSKRISGLRGLLSSCEFEAQLVNCCLYRQFRDFSSSFFEIGRIRDNHDVNETWLC